MKRPVSTLRVCLNLLRLGPCDEDQAHSMVEDIRAAVKAGAFTWRYFGFKNKESADRELDELVRQARVRDLRECLGHLREVLCNEQVTQSMIDDIKADFASGRVLPEELGFLDEVKAQEEFTELIRQAKVRDFKGRLSRLHGHYYRLEAAKRIVAEIQVAVTEGITTWPGLGFQDEKAAQRVLTRLIKEAKK